MRSIRTHSRRVLEEFGHTMRGDSSWIRPALGCHFFDAETVTTRSRVDGVHLDRDQHSRLSNALAEVVRPVLTPAGSRGWSGYCASKADACRRSVRVTGYAQVILVNPIAP
jgi:hypothetical protein